MTVIPEEVFKVKYHGRLDACGFIKEHEYLIKIDKDQYSYIVNGIEDITIEDDDIDIYMHISSEKSMYRTFEFINDGGNDNE